MLYFWFLRAMFIFCFCVVFYVVFINFSFSRGIYFSSSEDSAFWLMFCYPVMWLTLLMYRYELSNSDNDLARVVNSQNVGVIIQYLVFLHMIAFILFNVSHDLKEYTVHYFLNFLMYCALAYILFEFVIGVINMFYGVLYEIYSSFRYLTRTKL